MERPIRIVALSATAPNIQDIARWIGANGTGEDVDGEEAKVSTLVSFSTS